jgi:hypothetical protein
LHVPPSATHALADGSQQSPGTHDELTQHDWPAPPQLPQLPEFPHVSLFGSHSNPGWHWSPTQQA